MTTIRAQVNTRLLRKASRLFTGTLAGRIIEILQNARRAGARHVAITNRDGVVTVRDDGQGIDDFEKLLDLGGSGWEEKLEASEDPAGVGLFCLAPRPLNIRSKGQRVTIEKDGWTGSPVEVEVDPQRPSDCPGTELSFGDEPWDLETVSPLAVFTDMEVAVDGQNCPREPFIFGTGSPHPQLGCRIQVVRSIGLMPWHGAAAQNRGYGNNVLVNFHGQVISFSHKPVGGHDLSYLIDLTAQPTGIRLMLPARTCLVENEAFQALKSALELEAFRYLQQQGCHCLPYKQYLRAKELGVDLPEAEPCFRVGLLSRSTGPDPVEVIMPERHALAQCYRLSKSEEGDESDEANVHLLSALGQFEAPFVAVEIREEYDGYSWAKLPTVDRVELSVDKVLQDSPVGSGMLVCVETISIAAHCSDGRVFRSPVCLAVKPAEQDQQQNWFDDCNVYVTQDVGEHLNDEQIWYHLGGYNDEGDTYDTQLHEFREELDAFWTRLTGPDQPLRRKLLDAVEALQEGWRSVVIEPAGRVVINGAGGVRKVLLPPGQLEQPARAPIPLTVNHRELAAILAGLRLHQNRLQRHDMAEGINDIATDGGTLEALSRDEVGELCERLNQ